MLYFERCKKEMAAQFTPGPGAKMSYSFTVDPSVFDSSITTSSGTYVPGSWGTWTSPQTFANNGNTIWYSRKSYAFTEGVVTVEGLEFRTLVMEFDGQRAEVIWFEGESFADGMVRLAEAFR
jgi:hypothetical protein